MAPSQHKTTASAPPPSASTAGSINPSRRSARLRNRSSSRAQSSPSSSTSVSHSARPSKRVRKTQGSVTEHDGTEPPAKAPTSSSAKKRKQSKAKSQPRSTTGPLNPELQTEDQKDTHTANAPKSTASLDIQTLLGDKNTEQRQPDASLETLNDTKQRKSSSPIQDDQERQPHGEDQERQRHEEGQERENNEPTHCNTNPPSPQPHTSKPELPESAPLEKSDEPAPPELATQAITSPRDPVSYWAENQAWPDNFASYTMADVPPNKRQRLNNGDAKNSGAELSYAQKRKEGLAPEQYTLAWEAYAKNSGLILDIMEGERLLSEQGKRLCEEYQEYHSTDMPSSLPKPEKAKEVLHYISTRSESLISREVTRMIVPPTISLLADNLDASLLSDAYDKLWTIHFPFTELRPTPDVTVGLHQNAFPADEFIKLVKYKHWAKVTERLYFPFLTCAVNLGKPLEVADRQNMNSCSIAVQGILQLVKEADVYRKGLEPLLPQLSGQILAFSVSHDHSVARIHAYYAICTDDSWKFYRYRVGGFLIFDKPIELMAVHNFVRNVYDRFAPVHLQRLKDALAYLPRPTAEELAGLATDPPTIQEESGADEQANGTDEQANSAPKSANTPAYTGRSSVREQRELTNTAFKTLDKTREDYAKQFAHFEKMLEDKDAKAKDEAKKAQAQFEKMLEDKDAKAEQDAKTAQALVDTLREQLENNKEMAEKQTKTLLKQLETNEKSAQQQMNSLAEQLKQQREDSQRQLAQQQRLMEQQQEWMGMLQAQLLQQGQRQVNPVQASD